MTNHTSRPAAKPATTTPPTVPPTIAPRLELGRLSAATAVVWDDEAAVVGVKAPEDGVLVIKIVVGTVVTRAAESVDIKFELRITTRFELD